jgi:hypothetical protein
LLTNEMLGYLRTRLGGGLRQSIHYYRTTIERLSDLALTVL